jgi:hypothetical protein
MNFDVFLYSIDASSGIESTYSSELTTNSQMYSRTSCVLMGYYYEAVELNVTESGYYSIMSNSTINTYGYIYNNSFDTFNPTMNLVKEDDNSGCDGQFKFMIQLQKNTSYTLVVTTYSENVTGVFWVVIYGPNNVSFTRISKYLYLFL